MRLLRSALLGLVFASLSASAAIRLEPAGPTERSSIVLHLRDEWISTCFPESPTVERHDRSIVVTWNHGNYYGHCRDRRMVWTDEVPLGVFAPGVYNVVAYVRFANGSSRSYGQQQLIVREHTPTITVSPRIVSTGPETQVKIAVPKCGTVFEVTANGVPLTTTREGCDLVARMQSFRPGPVSIAMTVNGVRYESFGAMDYVDPAAAPDPRVYERMLVPVVLNAEGAFGSAWSTRARIHNRSFTDIDLIPEVSRPCSGRQCLRTLRARSSFSLNEYGECPDGLVLFVPRVQSQSVRFSSFAQNARDRSQYGAEVRVIREHELRTASFSIPDVPFDPRYRVQLRVYGVDGAALPVKVGVSIGDHYWAQAPLEMKGPCQQLPCNSNAPAFGSIDLGATFPWLFDGDPHMVHVVLFDDIRLRYWAFVSITDNETQHVSILTPH